MSKTLETSVTDLYKKYLSYKSMDFIDLTRKINNCMDFRGILYSRVESRAIPQTNYFKYEYLLEGLLSVKVDLVYNFHWYDERDEFLRIKSSVGEGVVSYPAFTYNRDWWVLETS